jgi:hypothetical protein
MFIAAFDTPDDLVADLVSTCEGTRSAATALARHARPDLRALLDDRAESYRRAMHELAETPQRERAPAAALAYEDCDDVATLWETVECSALLDFRDALDAPLDPARHATVRRCMEEGVSALERLRALRRR